ncbi:hypothetical protein [Paenibacillus lutrae]|uniref:Uncharacterized protein n=1 Tax=Paenibacillus lutrae TaxID=2078573 RepID=A0A7X3FLA5_9BACL|nr:hypothetical protein [Paenibacillus lutrae]MVP01713.1 hypothetical protein [Paenibacillus lutrae]
MSLTVMDRPTKTNEKIDEFKCSCARIGLLPPGKSSTDTRHLDEVKQAQAYMKSLSSSPYTSPMLQPHHISAVDTLLSSHREGSEAYENERYKLGELRKAADDLSEQTDLLTSRIQELEIFDKELGILLESVRDALVLGVYK